jgi:hypothetical protein
MRRRRDTQNKRSFLIGLPSLQHAGGFPNSLAFTLFPFMPLSQVSISEKWGIAATQVTENKMPELPGMPALPARSPILPHAEPWTRGPKRLLFCFDSGGGLKPALDTEISQISTDFPLAEAKVRWSRRKATEVTGFRWSSRSEGAGSLKIATFIVLAFSSSVVPRFGSGHRADRVAVKEFE